jgi:hypothetical protein
MRLTNTNWAIPSHCVYNISLSWLDSRERAMRRAGTARAYADRSGHFKFNVKHKEKAEGTL